MPSPTLDTADASSLRVQLLPSCSDWRPWRVLVLGAELCQTLNCHVDVSSLDSRVVWLIGSTSKGQDRLVLLRLPSSDLALQDWIFGRWLVNHV